MDREKILRASRKENRNRDLEELEVMPAVSARWFAVWCRFFLLQSPG